MPSVGELPVDAVVVDLPGPSRKASVERVRGRFSGPLVVLLGHGEDPAKARVAFRCNILTRPFGMSQLWSMLADSATEAVTEVIPAIRRAAHAPAQGPSGPPPEPPRARAPRARGAPARPRFRAPRARRRPARPRARAPLPPYRAPTRRRARTPTRGGAAAAGRAGGGARGTFRASGAGRAGACSAPDRVGTGGAWRGRVGRSAGAGGERRRQGRGLELAAPPLPAARGAGREPWRAPPADARRPAGAGRQRRRPRRRSRQAPARG